MYARWALNRMPVPPPSQADTNDRPAARTPSPTAFVSKIVLSFIAIVTAVTLIAAIPWTVMISLATVLVTGVVATALILVGGRRRSAGWRARRAANPRSSERRQRDEAASHMGWGALGAASLVLLVLALIAPEGPRVVLAASGLTGLAVLRLGAMRGGWVPRRSLVASRRAASGASADNGRREVSNGCQ